MICQKLCRNNLSKWGSLEVKFRDKLHLFCLDLFAAGSRTTTPVRTRIGGASWRLWRSCRWERSVGGSMFFVVWNKWGRTHAAIFSIFSMYLTMAIYGELWTDVIYPNLGHAFWEHVFDIGWIDEVCETIGWVGWGSLTYSCRIVHFFHENGKGNVIQQTILWVSETICDICFIPSRSLVKHGKP